MMFRAKHRMEYAALRAVGLVFSRLPYRLASAAAWPLAWLAQYGSRFWRSLPLYVWAFSATGSWRAGHGYDRDCHFNVCGYGRLIDS